MRVDRVHQVNTEDVAKALYCARKYSVFFPVFIENTIIPFRLIRLPPEFDISYDHIKANLPIRTHSFYIMYTFRCIDWTSKHLKLYALDCLRYKYFTLKRY